MWSIAIGLGMSRRDSWLVSEDMSANISREVAVTNGFSYLQCVNVSRRERLSAQVFFNMKVPSGNLHYERGKRQFDHGEERTSCVLTCARFIIVLNCFP